MADSLKRFTATFDSECDYCLGTVCEGELKARTPAGDYICEDCFDDYLQEEEEESDG